MRTTSPGLLLIAAGALGLWWLWRRSPESTAPAPLPAPLPAPYVPPQGLGPDDDPGVAFAPLRPFVPLPVREITPGEFQGVGIL